MAQAAPGAQPPPSLFFAPVDKTTKGDFIALMSTRGGPKFCWCMVWRATTQEGRGTSADVRRKQMLGRIDSNVPVGLLGYLDGTALAWVSIAPRPSYRRLKGPPNRPGDNIWSLACMYMHRSIRGKGYAHQLIAAATAHAKISGATHIEAYPVAPDAPSYRFMGFVPAFEKAGFDFVEMAGKRRHVMRRSLV